GGHLLERRRDLAGAAGDARVVEQDHLPVASQAIRNRRVPVVHGAEVVLAKYERHSSGLAESAIGEADSVSLYELRRRSLMPEVTTESGSARVDLRAGSTVAWIGPGRYRSRY